jgi:hypothetical protein
MVVPLDYIAPGYGVPRDKPAEPAEPAPAVVDGTPPFQEFPGDPRGVVWVDKPTYEDQADRYPTTVKMGPQEMDVFDLAKPDEKAALNAIVGGSQLQSPLYTVFSNEPRFCESTQNWKVLLRFAKVFYIALLKKKEKSDHE